MVYGFSGIITRFLGVFLIPIYTRIFIPEDYGVIGLVSTTMAVVSIFIVLGLDNSAHRWYYDTENIDDRKTTLASWALCQIVVSLIFALFIFIFSESLGIAIVHRSDAQIYFRLAAMALPLGVIGTVIINWLRMQRRPWETAGFSLGISLFNISLNIILVVIFQWGLKGIYISQIATGVLGTIIGIVLMKDWIHPERFSFERLKVMLKFALPLIPASLAYWLINLSGNYFIQGFSSTAEVGLYQVGTAIAAAIALISGAFQQAWGPFAMSIHKQSEAKKIYADVLLGYLWVTCLASTALSLFARDILRVFTTEAYYDASHVVGILAFNYVLIGLGYIAMTGPSIVKTTKPYAQATLLAMVIVVSLNLMFIPRFGKEGAALATFFGQSIAIIYLFYQSNKLYPIPYRFGKALGILIFSLILAFLGGTFSINNIYLSIAMKIMIILMFVPALFIFGIIKYEYLHRFLLSLRSKV
jgi:O-antigen/teichoic acid export membrane protein